MAEYTGMILTEQGLNLQAKAEAGATINFTKVMLGDGQPPENLETMTELVQPRMTLGIASVKAEGNGLCRITSNITNAGLAVGFFVREVGIYADDPDIGEILYGITIATTADYLPPEGNATLVNNQFEIIVVVGNAANITATITLTGYAMDKDVGSKADLTTADKTTIVAAVNEVSTNASQTTRTVASLDTANATDTLNIVNYLGNTQNIHPKVLCFEAGWNGYKYWMAYTPYPRGDTTAENPCIAVSNDAITWEAPSGAINPLDPAPADGYNSDTHLVYNSDTGRLEVWWRKYTTATYNVIIYRRTTSDGISWTQV